MSLPLPPASFAEDWAAAWNAHDLPRIMSHYATGVRFRSARALDIMGQAELDGIGALETYWREALRRQPDLRFTVERFYRGPGVVVISYRNQHDVQTAETLTFDHTGQVVFGAACRV